MAARALYIVSTETFAGKTAICAGLARWLEGTGRRVGYLKPLTVPLPGDDPEAGDDDARLMQRLLRLNLPARDLAPVWLDGALVVSLLRGEADELPVERVLAARARQAACDVLLVEGADDWRQGTLAGLSAAAVARLLDARVLVVTRYDGILAADRALAAREALGDRLIGAIFTAVDEPEAGAAAEIVAPALERRGLPVLGLMPAERALLAISVGELVRGLSGRLIVGVEAGDNLIEHLVIGAMNAEAALTYFRQRANKAVVTGGDRTDLQLAALETPTTCLVLTGNLYPSPQVVERARAQSVPIVLVEQDTLGAVREIERLFTEARFRQPRKVERLMPLLEEQVDLPRLLTLAGLTNSPAH
jgi:BioD-like phosphotransacetylase family protein